MSISKTKIALIVAAAFSMPVYAQDVETAPAQDAESESDRFQVLGAAERFFGDASSGIADVIEEAFGKYGVPNAFIEGQEFGAAFFGGVRYGQGVLKRREDDANALGQTIHWQGPTAGYDFGGNASKVMYLVYGLDDPNDLFQRFPSVEGNFFLGAGVGMTYQRANGVTLVPVRTGVGLRGGGSIGYVHFTRKASWLPL